MNNQIDKIKKVRLFLMEQVAELTVEQFNKIPSGFKNNIIWNLTHLICAQQGVCYLRSGQAAIVQDKYIAPFFTNTIPERIIAQPELEHIKSLFISTIDELQKDFERSLFNNYTASPNIFKIYGIELKSIDDAFQFLLYHEGYHAGCIMALKKLVR